MRSTSSPSCRAQWLWNDDLEVTYGGDAVGGTAVDNGGSLRAVGGVHGDSLGDSLNSGGTSGQGQKRSDGETHVGMWSKIRGMFEEVLGVLIKSD